MNEILCPVKHIVVAEDCTVMIHEILVINLNMILPYLVYYKLPQSQDDVHYQPHIPWELCTGSFIGAITSY